jgi:signal transduction histidine kinase
VVGECLVDVLWQTPELECVHDPHRSDDDGPDLANGDDRRQRGTGVGQSKDAKRHFGQQRLDLPVRVDVPAERLPAEIEASAYFVVAEALTNVVKHSHAGHAEVTGSLEDGMLRIEVRDNGAGGADPMVRGWWGCATG